MGIYSSSKDYATGVITMLWDGDRPSHDEFLDYAKENYGVTGNLDIEDPTMFKGLRNPGTAKVTPNTQINGACAVKGGMK